MNDAQARRPRVRPCIVMNPAVAGDRKVPIILMGTFHRPQRREDLPEILQHFCAPAYPHNPHEPHLHFTPEWENNCTWVIAITYLSVHRVEAPWTRRSHTAPDSTGEDAKTTFKCDGEAWDRLQYEQATRLRTWFKRCQEDPYTVPRCLEGYRQWRARVKPHH
ncbi:hypothetical protein C8Q77DRAFT_295991 [Trametes polyzona]|nr:hypothetical protein C8Q77DRAFT_295991 [Trametes polyzona]